MASVRHVLNQIWSQFRRVGIAEDLSIIEHIAALLTEGIRPYDKRLLPRKPPEYSLDAGDIKAKLEEAVQIARGKEVLFDRHVLFRLSNMLPGSRYPTPRHIVSFMQRLVEVESHNSLADLACGSGGFLVRRNSASQVASATGCEISADWARLAWANCVLHGVSEPQIEIGNAVSLCSEGGPLANGLYDRILMNPPFGEAVDPVLAKEVLGTVAGSRSETVLSQLALTKLTEDGRAGILVPSGILSSGSKGEKRLRQLLVEDCCLDALVSFPKDAFQPFSQLQTHLLLVHNQQPQEQGVTWFFRADKDGYPAGRSRDLTEDPNPQSDFAPVEAAYLSRTRGWDWVSPADQPLLGIKKLTDKQNKTLGLVVGAIDGAKFGSVEVFPVAREPSFVLVSARKEEDKVLIRLDLPKGTAENVEDYRGHLEQIYKKKKVEDIPRKRLPVESDLTCQLLLDADARYLGVAVPTFRIKAPEYDLRPEKYLKVLEEEAHVKSPAALLADIRKNQKELIRKIDGLLGRLDMPPIAKVQVPPPLWREEGEPVQPFGTLSEVQSKVWRTVSEQVQDWQEGEAEYSTPVHFTAEDVEPEAKLEASPSTHATLELMGKMGLIVLVSIVGSEGEKAVSCYRLASERDHWKLEKEQEPGEPEEDAI